MDIERRIRRLEWTNRLLFASLLMVAAYAATGFVDAAAPAGKIVADSVVTHALHVVSPYGKQSFDVEIGDSGVVDVALNGSDGKSTLNLLLEADGSPSMCVSDGHTCRIVIGSVSRNNQREISIQLRDKNGHTIWMPDVANPYTPPQSPCTKDYIAQHPKFRDYCQTRMNGQKS